MINIPNPPEVLISYGYEKILNAQLNDIASILPDYRPSEGDVLMIEKEASSYRELHLRAEFNKLSRAFFLATSTGLNLDNYALFYGVERLKGAKQQLIIDLLSLLHSPILLLFQKVQLWLMMVGKR